MKHGAVSLCVSVWVLMACLCECGAPVTHAEVQTDLCTRCQCLPTFRNPTQAICTDRSGSDKEFFPATTAHSKSLQMIFIYEMSRVTFLEESILTENPVTLILLDCKEVTLADGAVPRLLSIVVKDVDMVTSGVVTDGEDLLTTVYERIGQLTVSSDSLTKGSSVSVGRVESLTVKPPGDPGNSSICNDNPEFKFLLFNSKIKPLQPGAIIFCGSGEITMNGNTFDHISEDGFQISTEGSITLVYNKFKNLTKQAYNLTAPEIHISNNHFQTLPAGALRGVSTIQDSFFMNNTVKDVDLGGVLLDMGWDMVVEHNVIDCDCTSKRTSILNPKEDMIYLTNSSLEKLQIIFQYNFCSLDCQSRVSLKQFSNALKEGVVCETKNTKMEDELLCSVEEEFETSTVELTSVSEEVFDELEKEEERGFGLSAANRIEIIAPIVALVGLIVFISLVCGCREIASFKYKFKPNRSPSPPKIYLE